MERRYTEEVYNAIVATIDDIERTDFDWMDDMAKDIAARFLVWLKVINSEKYLDDISRYHALVLDAYNTKIEDLDRIFSSVESVDFTYRDYLVNGLASISEYKAAINTLSAAIQGQKSAGSVESQFNAAIYRGKKASHEAFAPLITRAESEAMFDASKELFIDALAFGAVAMAFLIDRTPLTAYKLSSAIVATFHDIKACFSIPFSFLLNTATQKAEPSLDSRVELIEDSREAREVNSIHDFVDNMADNLEKDSEQLSGPYKGLYDQIVSGVRTTEHALKVVDMAVTGTDLLSGSSGKEVPIDPGDPCATLEEAKSTYDLYKKTAEIADGWIDSSQNRDDTDPLSGIFKSFDVTSKPDNVNDLIKDVSELLTGEDRDGVELLFGDAPEYDYVDKSEGYHMVYDSVMDKWEMRKTVAEETVPPVPSMVSPSFSDPLPAMGG